MRLFILCSYIFILVGSASAGSAECQSKFANIFINLNGPFFQASQIERMMEDVGNMYYRGISLPDICNYMRGQQSLYCTTQQINTISGLMNELKTIVGSSDRVAELLNVSFTEALDFIQADQKELDALIAKEKAEGVDEDTIKRDMCRFMCQRYTAEKRAEMAKRILGYITPEHRVPIRDLLSTVMKLDDIDPNNVGTTPAGFEGF